jgi:hypothetical protein
MTEIEKLREELRKEKEEHELTKAGLEVFMASFEQSTDKVKSIAERIVQTKRTNQLLEHRVSQITKAVRCVHLGSFPCLQCLSNMKWNSAATANREPPVGTKYSDYLDVELTAKSLFEVLAPGKDPPP